MAKYKNIEKLECGCKLTTYEHFKDNKYKFCREHKVERKIQSLALDTLFRIIDTHKIDFAVEFNEQLDNLKQKVKEELMEDYE